MPKLRTRLFIAFMIFTLSLVAIFGWPTLLRRNWALRMSKIWVHSLVWGLRHIGGITCTFEGRENLPADTPAIVAPKHQSVWETIILMAYLPYPAFILKKNLGDIPGFGWWTKRIGFVFIDRAAGPSAIKQMITDSKATLAKGTRQIVIFPEGTRTEIGETGEYHPGVAALAKSLKLPVIPIAHNGGCFWRAGQGKMYPGSATMRYCEALPVGTPRKILMEQLINSIEPATRELERQAQQAGNPCHPMPQESLS